ncbi:predicted protein [Lichtheimia corymbifera JMRC:FSU:9682]|uniref:Uncharacterized protein n=1 Tax=Lichtheimia corymbifera JMRC:FSU:9682 TaxID=1263082 RepID=A0A068SFI0_9FUNG|nr:predicted protein [Lichtheimia corymbifera JMRC:FSU:9682]
MVTSHDRCRQLSYSYTNQQYICQQQDRYEYKVADEDKQAEINLQEGNNLRASTLLWYRLLQQGPGGWTMALHGARQQGKSRYHGDGVDQWIGSGSIISRHISTSLTWGNNMGGSMEWAMDIQHQQHHLIHAYGLSWSLLAPPLIEIKTTMDHLD